MKICEKFLKLQKWPSEIFKEDNSNHINPADFFFFWYLNSNIKYLSIGYAQEKHVHSAAVSTVGQLGAEGFIAHLHIYF